MVENSKLKISLFSLFIPLIGIIFSFYALFIYINSQNASNLSCNITEFFNCTKIMTSIYSEFYNIPFSAWSLSFWFVIFGIIFLQRFTKYSLKIIYLWQLFVSFLGFIFFIIYAYIAFYIVKGEFFIHIIIYINSIILLFLSVYKFIKIKDDLNFKFFIHSTFLIFIYIICFAIPPIILGYIFKSFNISSTSTIVDKKVEVINFNKYLSINKSNFVGNGEDYRLGNDNAKAILHVFTDPECPHCATRHETILEVLRQIGEQNMLVVFHLIPISSECGSKGHIHDNACRLAIAARCAGQQKKFFEVLDWSYKKQEEAYKDSSVYSFEGIRRFVTSLEINTDIFNQCLEAKAELSKIKDDVTLAENQLGITGTPTLMINAVKLLKSDVQSIVMEVKKLMQ